MLKAVPGMPLLLQEGLTTKLLEALKLGEIDVAVVAEPMPVPGVMSWPVYDEPFVVVVPTKHPWAARPSVDSTELKDETMLLLGAGHCFRDQMLKVCPELSRYSQTSAGARHGTAHAGGGRRALQPLGMPRDAGRVAAYQTGSGGSGAALPGAGRRRCRPREPERRPNQHAI